MEIKVAALGRVRVEWAGTRMGVEDEGKGNERLFFIRRKEKATNFV